MERTRARDVLSLLMQRFAESGVEGLRLGEPEPALDAGGDECGLRVTLEAAIPYERIDDARTLVSRALAFTAFADVERFSALPIAESRRYAVSVTLVAFDPHRTLRSNAAQAALDRAAPADWWRAANEAGRAEIEKFLEGNPSWRDVLERRVLVSRMAVGGNEDEWEEWLKPLPEEPRLAVEDVRNLRELKRSHDMALEYLDEWLHKRDGAAGKRIERGVWVPILGRDGSPPAFANGVTDLPEVGGTPDANVDLEAICARIDDRALEEGDRLDALRELCSHGPAGLSLAARSLGHERIRLNALSYVDYRELQPLFREIVFTRDGRRVFAALEAMRGWKRSFDDPRRAWEIAQGMPGDAYLGELEQGSILREYARTGDRSAIPELMKGLEDATRSPEWRRTALRPLEVFEAAEAAPVILRAALAEAGDSDTPLPDSTIGMASESISFFAKVPYPPARRLLVRALKCSGICSAFATTALRSLGPDGVPPLVEEAERLARTTFRGEHIWADSTARALVREFATIQKETGALPVSEKTLRKLVDLVPDLLEDVEELLHPAPPIPADADESTVKGASPEKTFELRRARWLAPGYAASQYQKRGHRGAWDSIVLSAHARYVATQDPGKDPALRGEYEKALQLGCRDGIVAYRDAVVRVFAREGVDAKRFRNAAEWIPSQYPDSPYVSSAWVKVAQAARLAGDTAEALDAARRAVDGVCHDPDARRLLDELEAQAAALESARTLTPLSLGTLLAAPSLWHAATVTSLHLSSDGALVVSADSAGFVQVSQVVPADHYPRAIPDVREKLHSAEARARWTAPGTFTSVGAGGDLCVVEYRPGSRFSVRRIAADTAEARALYPRVPRENPERQRNADYEATLLPHGGIDVRGLRQGLRGVSSSGGSSGRFVRFDACFAHRILVYATEHRKLGLTSWGN